MKYKDEKHKKAYLQAIQRDRVDVLDLERRALLYLLTLPQDTRDHLSECYNFDTGGFRQECSGSACSRVTRHPRSISWRC